MRKLLPTLLLFFTYSFSSCQNQLKDGNINLETVDFNSFSAKRFYAHAVKAAWSEYNELRKKDVRPIYFFQAEVDTLNLDGEKRKVDQPYALSYLQTGRAGMPTWKDEFNVGFFKSVKFDEVNAITDLKDHLLLISGTAEEVKKDVLSQVVTELNKQYGNYVKSEQSTGFSAYETKKWVVKDKTIILVSNAKLDYNNVVLTDKQKEYAKEFEARNFESATIFICKNDNYEAFKAMSTRTGFMTNFEK